MTARVQDVLRQPLLGTAALGLALGAVALVTSQSAQAPLTNRPMLVLAAALTAALVLTQFFPIHVHQNTKIHMGSVVLYLMAVLLPPPLAGPVAFAGMLVGEVLNRRVRDVYPSDIASQVGRWTLVALLGSLIAHLPEPHNALRTLPLVGAAIVMWGGDFLTCPILLCPITGESPRRVIVTMAREASVTEGAQYLIGILGAIAAQQLIWSVVLLALPTMMVHMTGKRSKELQDQTRKLLEHMADTVDLRDPYTGGHSRRVTEYTRGILRELGLQGPDVELTIAAARVHDIGKIAMPDDVLLKEGKLTDEEWLIMKRHPAQGADLLMRYPDFARGAEIVRHHHERWDGAGYPDGLRERDIPFGARVIAVADSFDAMTSDRPYRPGMPVSRAVEILRAGRGQQWDPAIVDAFLRSITDQLFQPEQARVRSVSPIASGVSATV